MPIKTFKGLKKLLKKKRPKLIEKLRKNSKKRMKFKNSMPKSVKIENKRKEHKN